MGGVARHGIEAGDFCGAQPLLLLGCGGGRGGLRGLGFDIIPCGNLLAGVLGLLAHSDIFGAILRYISLCAYIGKDPPI